MLESERQDLQRRLDQAVRDENYELAAHLRDQLTPVKAASYNLTSSGSVRPPWNWDPDNIRSLEPYRMPDMKRMQDDIVAFYIKQIDKALSERMIEIEGHVPSKYEAAPFALSVKNSTGNETVYEYFWKSELILRATWKFDLHASTEQRLVITKIYKHG